MKETIKDIDELVQPFTVPPLTACPKCRTGIVMEGKYTDDYFKKNPIQCPNCKELVDWWQLIIDSIKSQFPLKAFSPIGAQSNVFSVPLERRKKVHLKLTDYGVPKEAKILYINYSPQTPDGKGFFPLEIHGNVPIRHRIPREVMLYPMPISEDDPDKECRTSVLVTWVSQGVDDESWEKLVEAFEAYSQGRYSEAIIPSNVAVESKLTRFLKTFLIKFAGRENVDFFLDNAATYGHQLNVILPMITSLTNNPPLPERIRGHLNHLKKLRNQLAHDGKLQKPLDPNKMAELLCAALFGFRYVNMIEDTLKV